MGEVRATECDRCGRLTRHEPIFKGANGYYHIKLVGVMLKDERKAESVFKTVCQACFFQLKDVFQKAMDNPESRPSIMSVSLESQEGLSC